MSSYGMRNLFWSKTPAIWEKSNEKNWKWFEHTCGPPGATTSPPDPPWHLVWRLAMIITIIYRCGGRGDEYGDSPMAELEPRACRDELRPPGIRPCGYYSTGWAHPHGSDGLGPMLFCPSGILFTAQLTESGPSKGLGSVTTALDVC